MVIERKVMKMNECVIECNNLTKYYRKQCALDHVNMKIMKGEIYGLIGQNGAGKSTIMKMIGGLIHPSDGDFRLFGKHPKEDPFIYRRIGTLIEEPGIYKNMTALQNMHVKALAMGCNDKKDLCELLTLCGLDPHMKKKAGSFSLGMKQRLGLALTMVGDPELLILDEPVNGLDPQGITDIRNALLKLNYERNITIIISSHILEELSKIATSYGIIKDGVLIRNLTKAELESSCRDYCRIQVNDASAAAVVLEKVCHVKNIEIHEDQTLYLYDDIDTSLMNETLIKNHVRVYEIMMHKQNLEAYFLDITGGKTYVE